VQEGADDLKQSRHGFTCMHERPPPQEKILYFEIHLLIIISYNIVNTVYFSPLKVKNKPCEEVLNVRLFLGLLA
jgi:hypothetical protein